MGEYHTETVHNNTLFILSWESREVTQQQNNYGLINNLVHYIYQKFVCILKEQYVWNKMYWRYCTDYIDWIDHH